MAENDWDRGSAVWDKLISCLTAAWKTSGNRLQLEFVQSARMGDEWISEDFGKFFYSSK